MRSVTITIIVILAALAIVGGRAIDLPVWAIVALVVTLIGSGFLSILLLNLRTPPPVLKARTKEEEIAELESQGGLESTTYEATRAFNRGDAEGLHYFIELADGSVMYLDGQYLEEYEPSAKQARRFPCTEFDLLRSKGEGYIVGLRCRGKVINPQHTVPPADHAYPPQDGEILKDRTYDELLTAR